MNNKKYKLFALLVIIFFMFGIVKKFSNRSIYVFEDEYLKENIEHFNASDISPKAKSLYLYNIEDREYSSSKNVIVAFFENKKLYLFPEIRVMRMSYIELGIFQVGNSLEFVIQVLNNKVYNENGEEINEKLAFIVKDIYFIYSIDGKSDALIYGYDLERKEAGSNNNSLKTSYTSHGSSGNSKVNYKGDFWTYKDYMNNVYSLFDNRQLSFVSGAYEAQLATSRYRTFDNKSSVWNTLVVNFFEESKLLSKQKNEMLKEEGDLIKIDIRTDKYSEEDEEAKALYGIGFNVYARDEFGFYNKYIKTFEIYDIISF